MILIKKVTFDEVPLLSLQGWKLHGAPIVEQYVYGSITDCRGWPHQGFTNVCVYQAMKKEIEIAIKYEKDILEYLKHLEKEKPHKEYEYKLIISNIENELNKQGCRITYNTRGEYVLRWSINS